jgi:hypothetical protein
MRHCRPRLAGNRRPRNRRGSLYADAAEFRRQFKKVFCATRPWMRN